MTICLIYYHTADPSKLQARHSKEFLFKYTKDLFWQLSKHLDPLVWICNSY